VSIMLVWPSTVRVLIAQCGCINVQVASILNQATVDGAEAAAAAQAAAEVCYI
jgi:hypothetical protein